MKDIPVQPPFSPGLHSDTAESLSLGRAADILDFWKIRPARFRPEAGISGSPERCLFRTVVEDETGGSFILESLDSRTTERRRDIARSLAVLGRRLPEVRPYLPLEDGSFVLAEGRRFWQVSPFVEGCLLQRPEYAGEGWRGPVLADFLVRLKEASAELPDTSPAGTFSPAGFVRSLEPKIRDRNAALHGRILPAFRYLEGEYFEKEPGLSTAFAHGDYHPLNVIWTKDGIAAVIDWEFSGLKPELYDAAILVGCLGMEHPRYLADDLAVELIAALKNKAGYVAASWASFFDLVLALRFAWLSDWLRRKDAEMIDLEAVYIDLLLENREFFRRNWAL
jgi:homoserine kinase type II